VYLDESFVHHHYARHDDILFDPTDVLDKPAKAKHKGQRYCFIAAIAEGGVDATKLLALDIFRGGKTPGKKVTKDYHGMFDHQYFVGWFQRLLHEMSAADLKNAIICMDNAKYHKGKPIDTPKYNNRKADLVEACRKYSIDICATDTKPVIWKKLKVYVQANVLPVVVEMAHKAGHEVIYTPPHHSDLQPIELPWATVKGYVGRQYNVHTTFKDVHERLVRGFELVSSSTMHGFVQKTEALLLKFNQYMIETEEDSVDSSSDRHSDGTDDDDVYHPHSGSDNVESDLE